MWALGGSTLEQGLDTSWQPEGILSDENARNSTYSIHIYIYVYIYLCICTCTNISTFTYTDICMYTHIYVYTCTYIDVYTHRYEFSCKYMSRHIDKCICICICIYIYISTSCWSMSIYANVEACKLQDCLLKPEAAAVSARRRAKAASAFWA